MKLDAQRPLVDIGIVCSRFEESLHFYRDLLELPVVLDLDVPAEVALGAGLAPRPFRQVRLKAGRTLIKLMQIERPPQPGTSEFAAGVRWLTFFVENAWESYRALQAKGVKFLAEPVAAPDAAGVVCAVDPDGVLVELVELLPDFAPDGE